jgi:hypothetical protein
MPLSFNLSRKTPDFPPISRQRLRRLRKSGAFKSAFVNLPVMRRKISHPQWPQQHPRLRRAERFFGQKIAPLGSFSGRSGAVA